MEWDTTNDKFRIYVLALTLSLSLSFEELSLTILNLAHSSEKP